MESNINEIREAKPLDMSGGWEAQVKDRNTKVEEDRQKMRAWEEEQERNRKDEVRAKRILYALAFALLLITAGGLCLNCVESVSVWVSVAMTIGGSTFFAFIVGWICGYKAHR